MTVLNLQVNASANDAYQDSGDTADITATGAVYGTGTASASPDRTVGLRFTNVTIPPGATINSATLTQKKNGNEWSTVIFTWRGEAADNAAAFSGGEDMTARALTTASVSCSENTNHTGGTFYSLPAGADLKTIVQEIVDRAGWASGNALVMLAIGDSASSFASNSYFQYDNAAADAAKLDIDYTAGGTAYNETAGVIEAWTASAADTRAGVDTSAAILGLVAASSDTRAAVDTGAATLGLTASAADTFSQSDTTAALLGWVASSGDTGAGTDTTTAALGWLAAGADTFAQTDTTEAILGWVASGADTFDGGATAYNETAEALLGWDAGAADTFSHSDTAAAELDFIAAAGETYAGFDTASPVIEWTVSASDSTASIDSVMALLGWTASVSDSTVSPDPSRIVVDVFQVGRQVAQANKAVGQKIRKVSG